MKCEKCGNIIEDKYIWCPVCGAKKPKDNTVDSEEAINNSLAVYCQCGQKLKSGWKFCPNCKVPIFFEIKTEQKKANKYLIIYAFSVGVYILSSFIPYMFYFSKIALLVGLVTIITGKIKCPKSVIIKVLFWVTLAYVIYVLVLTLWLIWVCTNGIRSC